MIAYIDHVTIAVNDVSQATAGLRTGLSLITATPKHDEQSDLTNAVIPLTRGYLELVSPGTSAVAKSNASRRLKGFLESRQGLFSFALNSGDIERDVAMLRERGSTMAEPVKEEIAEN